MDVKDDSEIGSRSDAAGRIGEPSRHATDGIGLSEDAWGYVDPEGNIWQRNGAVIKGHIVGKMRGKNPAAALGYFTFRFKEIEKRFEQLESEARSADYRASFLDKVHVLLKWMPEANALGDFEGLIGRLRTLEQKILDHVDQEKKRKEELCVKAEALIPSEERTTFVKMRKLMEAWKKLGSAGREADKVLWHRFREAQQAFYTNRKKRYFERCRKEEEARARKEELCLHAELLSASSEWKATADALKGLREEWKLAGFAGREHDPPLWRRFNSACGRFFDRRSEAYERSNREREQNLRRKNEICLEVESLAGNSDLRGAISRIKELQAEWKTIGFVPRERNEEVWQRFRAACDVFFTRARAEYEQRRAAFQEKSRDSLEHRAASAGKIRESISHDYENIARWENTISRLRPGGRADEIRESLNGKINDVRGKISRKESRIAEILGTINPDSS